MTSPEIIESVIDLGEVQLSTEKTQYALFVVLDLVLFDLFQKSVVLIFNLK